MSPSNDTTHEWYDAWILYAVLLTARPDGHAELDQIIAAADFVNHAIPTPGELDSALNRLIYAGWVEQSTLCFAPSVTAEAMYSGRREPRSSVHEDLEFVGKEIGAKVWSASTPLPETPKRFTVAGLSEAELQNAYQKYQSRFSSK